MKHFFKISLLLSFCLVFCCKSSAQDQPDFRRFGKWVLNDPVSIFQNFRAEHLIGIGTAGLSIATLSTLDGPTSQNFQELYRNSSVLDLANTFGTKKVILPASVALFGSSLLTRNTKFQDAAFTSLQSVLMTSLTVGAGKFIFARERPYKNEGVYDFDFFSDETSFPSGHTARAFSFVTPWVVYYPGPLTYALLAIPAGTAIARIAEGKHWLSDVSAGAVIGFSMGYYLSKQHLGTQNMQVTPSFGKNMAALSINFQF